MIRENATISITEMATELGVTSDGIKYHIKKLTSLGKIERIGGTHGGSWRIIE